MILLFFIVIVLLHSSFRPSLSMCADLCIVEFIVQSFDFSQTFTFESVSQKNKNKSAKIFDRNLVFLPIFSLFINRSVRVHVA